MTSFSFGFTSRALLGVELDDQLLLNRSGDLFALRQAQDLCGQCVVIGLQPRRNRRGQLGRRADGVRGARVRPDRDHVIWTDLVAGDVHSTAVDVPVAVADELACLAPRGGKAEANEHVVEASLEETQKIVARDSLL